MNKADRLRRQCAILMAEKGYSKKGSKAILAKMIKKNRNSLSMALSGYRCGPGSEQILKELKEKLREL